jgi:septal ring factor EnvC (AmiA/AmiB activator)
VSIKPIDLQVMMPKTSEISKVSSEANQRNTAYQQQQAVNGQNKADSNLKQVYSREKSQEARIREKQEKGRENSGNKQKERKRQRESNNKHEPGDKKSTIDIRL